MEVRVLPLGKLTDLQRKQIDGEIKRIAAFLDMQVELTVVQPE